LDPDSIEWPAALAAGPVVVILAAIALVAILTAVEAALLSVSRYRLRTLARLGNRSARRAELLLAQSDRPAATLLLCRVAVTVTAGALAGYVTTRLTVGMTLPILLAIAIAAVTVSLIVVGDIAARAVGARFAEPIALATAWLANALMVVLQPITWILAALSKGVLRVIGVSSARTQPFTADGRDAGPERLSHQRMLTSILELQTIAVEDIMVPRNEIASIDVSDDWDTTLELLRTTPHTRLPLCEDSLDNVIGIVHMKKVAHALARDDLSREMLLRIAREREAYFVPEGTTLDVQLQNFQRDRRRIALVVDEYGDIRGLVTLEDILEEIVGEFTSDPGTLHRDIHRDTDGSYVINGAISVRILNRTLGWSLPTNGPRTLNGLILEYLENIPEPGTTLRLGVLSIEILQAIDNAVKTARIRPIEEQEDLRREAKDIRREA
jgi:Mg2+/Co2+ transporter CorB